MYKIFTLTAIKNIEKNIAIQIHHKLSKLYFVNTEKITKNQENK